MTIYIILTLIFILIVGFVIIYKRLTKCIEKHSFATEFRDRFIDFVNIYYQSYDSWVRRGKIDNEQYIWLTMNVNRMQGDLGTLGTMHYVAPFQLYQISNYQILINTIPKFRDGKVQEFDINSSDDCLLRYIGFINEIVEANKKKIRNPIIWFREGFHEIMSLPLLIFNWFGILSNNYVSKIMTNTAYKVLTGLAGLVAFLSGIVTIIQGKQETIEMIKRIIGK
jgi:hypothetical protein